MEPLHVKLWPVSGVHAEAAGESDGSSEHPQKPGPQTHSPCVAEVP